MAKLVAYGLLGEKGTMAGSLAKAQCEICGKKYGSVEEARKCEVNHVAKYLRDAPFQLFEK